MPCRDDYPSTEAYNIRAELEPLLCEACDLLEKEGLLEKSSADLRAWAKKT